ncbi:MAG TPA: hypothetical protein PLI62_16850 [Spirochaetota bacterium]|nr:hypothetical protein [Spirochaetota bacterium]
MSGTYAGNIDYISEVNMSFFKEAGDSLIKYTEKLVNKTEEYAKIGKLTLDIKKLESGIDKIHKEIGEYLMTKLHEGADSLSFSDQIIQERSQSISDNLAMIKSKRAEIEELKKVKPAASPSQPSGDISGSQPPRQDS